MITKIEDYFTLGCGRCARFATADCSALRWQEGLATLRQIALDAGLIETAKWGHPTYMHANRNIAIIGAFRGDFRLTFFNAALLSDPEGALEKQGPNTTHPDCLRFIDTAAPTVKAALIRAMLAEAMDHAKACRVAPQAERVLDLPKELVEALDVDPELAEAFHALTTGRQKSWALIIGSTSVPATRNARIAKARPLILAGKGAHDR